jgi:hypothetical protein
MRQFRERSTVIDRALAGILDQIDGAAAIVTAKCGVVAMNPKAEAMVRMGTILQVRRSWSPWLRA